MLQPPKVILLLIVAISQVSFAQPAAKYLDWQLQEIDQRLALEYKLAEYWQWGWVAGYTANIVGRSLSAANMQQHRERIPDYTGIFRSAIGLTAKAIAPHVAYTTYPEFQALPSFTEEQKRHKIQKGLKYLKIYASEADKRYSFRLRIPGLILNALSAYAIYRLGNKKDIGPNVLSALVSYEFLLWTRPWTGSRSLHPLSKGQSLSFGAGMHEGKPTFSLTLFI